MLTSWLPLSPRRRRLSAAPLSTGSDDFTAATHGKRGIIISPCAGLWMTISCVRLWRNLGANCHTFNKDFKILKKKKEKKKNLKILKY